MRTNKAQLLERLEIAKKAKETKIVNTKYIAANHPAVIMNDINEILSLRRKIKRLWTKLNRQKRDFEKLAMMSLWLINQIENNVNVSIKENTFNTLKNCAMRVKG